MFWLQGSVLEIKQGMGVGLAFTANANWCNIPTNLVVHVVCCPFKPTLTEGTDCVCACALTRVRMSQPLQSACCEFKCA